MKKTILVLFSLALCINAFADEGVTIKENITNDSNAPISTNRFIDNWFVSAGAGVNTILDNGYLGLTGLGTDVAFGKWFTPSAGFRFGWHGLSNKAKDTSNGWFAGDNSFGYHFIHADFMWDVLNTFKYNEKRFVSIVPMIQGGYIVTSYDGRNYSEFGYGAAFQIGLNLGKRIRVNLELAATFAREEAWRKAGTLICFPSASAGLQVNIGKTGFDRRVKTVTRTETITVPADCGHEAIIAALRAKIERLQSSVKSEEPKRIDGWVTYFLLDKSNLLERERYHLMDLVNILPEGSILTIVGHADKETGTKRRNAILSQERVKTVEKALRSLGFTGEIHVDFKGDTANPFESPYPKNRCVTISVTLPE